MALEGALPATTPLGNTERRSADTESAGSPRSDEIPLSRTPRWEGSPDEEPEPDDESSPTAEAYELTPGALLLANLERESAADRKRLRWTLLVAAVFHLVLLLLTLPQWDHETKFVGRPGKVFVMEQVRFQKPPQRARQEQKIPDPKKKRIPIPDPTPDDPEPLPVEELEIPDLPPTDIDEFFFGIPEGPDPGFGAKNGGFTGDALQVGDGILAPVGISKPQPRYTEEARQARIQGVVILSCIIDEEGNVRNLTAVKSLPMGLTESALETVATWTYKPARTNTGKPVAVYYHITVGFWLQ